METTLDQLGRIVLPQEIRDDLGLSPGAILQIEETNGGILLKPLGGRSGLVRKEGVLIFTGEVEGDIPEAVQRDRAERSRKLTGLG